MLNKVMQAFSGWFSSPAGVIETFSITFVIVVIEHVFPSVDPNGFLLLYWLTIYSGVTQPVLAYAAYISSNKVELILQNIQQMMNYLKEVVTFLKEMMTDMKQIQKNQTDMMKLILAMAEATQKEVHEIAEDIEDMQEEELDD